MKQVSSDTLLTDPWSKDYQFVGDCMQQKYYRADYGHFKTPVLPGCESYGRKFAK
jgi:hypothetical protein